ncbi:glutathione S-transferase [Streptomyces sp. AcH 505]|uniref:glutathione S-transferase C-terminal domain-containing protein n=1 Tax=unclassified Streptomyces TaxID=2593676 RepID=UPI0005920D17|nr:glutathione S-transferase C-terminal domain-containing protein [Streptomyces sp. NBC_00370]KIF71736.1 glutathione S-transferase [Streptomyces sp. AcH 505]
MSATSPTAEPSVIRGRIGCDARSGHYPVPRRYRLHLSPSCPYCLQIAVTHSLLELGDALPVTLLPAVPDAPEGGYTALRPLYEASSHHYPGPVLAPVLSDTWTGRLVSTYAPDILLDLAERFGGAAPALRPRGTEREIDELTRLCEQDINQSARRAGRRDADCATRDSALRTLFRALDTLEEQLAGRAYVLGDDGPTAADVQVWVALLLLDTVHRPHLGAAAAQCVADYPNLWAYAERLSAHREFGAQLHLDAIQQRHHTHHGCPPHTDTTTLVDWAAHETRYAPAGSPVESGC